MLFLNLTNHALTSEQRDDAKHRFDVQEFIELPDELKTKFGQVPCGEDEGILWDLADEIKDWVFEKSSPKISDWVHCQGEFSAEGLDDDLCPVRVLLQGELGLVGRLLRLLEEAGIPCFYATTRRESVETTQPDGSVVKTNVFKHAGFRRILPNTF